MAQAGTLYDYERDYERDHRRDHERDHRRDHEQAVGAPRRWGPVEAVELLRKAETFARAAWLAIDEDREVATDVATLAAVTAADAVACIRLGRRSTPPGHREAARLLLQADPDAEEASRVVSQLLRMRGRRGVPLTDGEARRAVIRAARVVEYAQTLAMGEEG